MSSKLLRFLTSALLVAGLAGSLFAASGDPAKPACDRACLDAFLDRYLDALVANDASRLPLAKTIKFTENGQRLELNDGLWNTATAKGSYRLPVVDTQAGQIAYIGTIREAGIPTVLAARLKVEDQKISEIETLVVRDQKAAQNLEKLGKPHPRFSEVVPPAERASREELIRIANMYFSGIEMNDGKGEYPFSDDCNRIENGMQTTNNPNLAPPPPGSCRRRAPSSSAE